MILKTIQREMATWIDVWVEKRGTLMSPPILSGKWGLSDCNESKSERFTVWELYNNVSLGVLLLAKVA